jgi:TRAP-type uncharacterized transport system substrate-binding protein
MTHRVIGMMGIAISVWLMPACISARGAAGKTEVSIATSSKGGYYYSLCMAMQKEGTSRGLTIDCRKSNGSQENIYQLDNGDADFALVQGDVAHRAWRGEPPFEETHSGIKLVTPLFTEKLHILVRPHQYMTSMNQFKGKKIWLGGKNSGTRMSAYTVMLAAGIDKEELGKSVKKLDNQAAFALIRTDRGAPALDAVIDTQLPVPQMLSATLESFGIKRYDSPTASHHASILLRPDLPINNLTELNGKNVRLGPGCSQEQITALSTEGIVDGISTSTPGEPVLQELRDKKIDVLVEPTELPASMVAEILAARGNRTFSLGMADTANGQKELEVFLPRESKITSAAQLAGKKLWWPDGDEAMDHSITRLILGADEADAANGHSPKVQAVREIDSALAMELLRQGELDGVFQVSVAPNSALEKVINNSTEVSLMSIDWPMVEKLVEDGSYVETSLQPSEYKALDHGVYTVGVQTLLLTRLGDSREDKEKVRMIAQLIHDTEDSIESDLGVAQKHIAEVNGAGGTAQLAAAPSVLTLVGSPVNPRLVPYIHRSADPYLIKSGIRHRALVEVLVLLVLLVLVCGTALFMEWGRHFAAYYPARALLVSGCVLVWAIGAVWLQAVEGDISQDFSCFHEAGMSLALSVIHHFGLPVDAAQATTRSGQFALEVFSWLGVLLVGGFCIPFVKWLWEQVIEPRLEKWRAPKIFALETSSDSSNSDDEAILKTTA